MINDKKQEEKLINLMNQYLSQIEPLSKSIIVTGSVSYSSGYNILPTSDLDLLTIIDRDKLPEITKQPVFHGYHLEIPKHSVDIISTRHQYNGCLFTVHFMTEKTFVEKYASIHSATIVAFRKNPKDYVYNFRSFDGHSIDVPVRNIPVSDGYLVEYSNCLYVDTLEYIHQYFAGSPHQKLISSPLVLSDVSGKVISLINDLKSNIVKMFRNEQHHLHHTLVKKERVHPQILEELLMFEKREKK